MSNNLINYKDYTKFKDSYQLVLPLSLESLIPEDDSVRLHSHVMEGLDYTKLYQAYASTGRKPAVEPQIMCKVVTYAYSKNIYSSRKIEKACLRDINFRWLLAGTQAPDHCAISRFRQFYLTDEVVDDIFYQQVRYLAEVQEIQYENVFIDGTKIEANANRYTFVWKKVIRKNEEMMYPKIQTLIAEINQAESKGFFVSPDTLPENMNQILEWLETENTERKITFVHGIGKRKSLIQKWTE